MSLLLKISGNRIVQHVCFWVLYLGPCIHSLVSAYGTRSLLPVSGIIAITLLVCYFNLYFLIPRFLLREKIIIYGFTVSLLTLFYAFVWTLLFVATGRLVFHSTKEYDFCNMYFGNLFDQSTTIAITTALKLSKDWFRQQQRNKELVMQGLYSEIRLLKAQVNPHFLFNTLNSLYAHTLKKSDKAPETVLKLSNIMEYMLYASNEPEVPLEKELKYLEDYIDLERLRKSRKTEIEFAIMGHINGQKIAPLLLLPFIENAFKHGINKIADKAYVHINIIATETELELKIENNKPALPVPNQNATGYGFGIKNVMNRLELMYEGRYDLDIKNEAEYYLVNLKIELV